MSARLVQAVLTSDIKPAGFRMVAFVLAWHADDATALAWPGRSTIAREAGLSADQVARYLAVLEKRGVVAVVVRGGSSEGRRWVTRYRVCLAAPGAPTPPVGDQTGGMGADIPGAPMRSNRGRPCPPEKNERKNPSGSSLSFESATRTARPVAPRGRSGRAAGRAAVATTGYGFDAADRAAVYELPME